MTDYARVRVRATIFAAHLIGGVSLLWFGLFLLLGPLPVFDLRLSTSGALVLDGTLCLAFFLQHSGMVRRSFQVRLSAVLPESHLGAFYTIWSGLVLLVMLVLWQPANPALVSVEGMTRWALRAFFLMGVVGFAWGVRSLGSFDGFGTRLLRAEIRGRDPKASQLTIRGPYRWVRHPLYTFVIVLLWSFPDLTADRLLLNFSWTAWIIIGSVLEERDLVGSYGDAYKDYQRRVPMLFPTRFPRAELTASPDE